MTTQQAYEKYLKEWYNDHSEPEYEGMHPVCFDEWYNYERLEEGI